MKVKICKAKGCETQITKEEKYCSYHKNKKAETRGNVAKGILGVAGMLALIGGVIKTKE